MDSEHFLKPLDLPIALFGLALGVVFVVSARKNRAEIMKKVKSGKYTEAEGQSKDKTFRICAYVTLLIGIVLTISWYFRR